MENAQFLKIKHNPGINVCLRSMQSLRGRLKREASLLWSVIIREDNGKEKRFSFRKHRISRCLAATNVLYTSIIANCLCAHKFITEAKMILPQVHSLHHSVIDLAGIQTLNFTIALSLTHVGDFPMGSPVTLTDTLVFFTATPDSCRTLQLCLLGNSDRALLSLYIPFRVPVSHQPPTIRISFCYQHTDWNSFRGFLCDVPWN